MTASGLQLSLLPDREYAAGSVTDIDADSVPPGLGEEGIRLISARQQEPQFLLDWRLKSCRHRDTRRSLHSRFARQTPTADERIDRPDVNF